MHNFGRTPLLSTESAAAFEAYFHQLERELKPQDTIERRWVHDYAVLDFDIERYRRAKIGTIQSAMVPALAGILLLQMGACTSFPASVEQKWKVEQLAREFFRNPESKKEILQMLAHAGLDEGVIEAGAYRLEAAALSSLDKTLSDLERRRYRLLRNITKKRKAFADKIRQTASKVSMVEANRHAD